MDKILIKKLVSETSLMMFQRPVSKTFYRIFIGTGFLLLVINNQKVIQAAAAPVYSPNITPGSPVVILIDNSGSMGICSNTNPQGKCIIDTDKPYKIDIVKDGIRRRITQLDLGSTQIGLVEIGDYKSYGFNYEKRCSAMKPLLSIGYNSQSQIISALEKIRPNDNGVTPITYAIDHIATNLERQGTQTARILLITDGQPNCNEGFAYKYLCRLVDSLSTDTIKLKIDIIGFRASGKDSEFIECAEKHPGMLSYASASTPDELDQKLNQALPTTEKSKSPINNATPKSTSDGSQDDSGSKWWISILVALIGGAATIFAAMLQFRSNPPRKKEEFIVRVLDSKTNTVIKGAKVSLEAKGIPITLFTDGEGIVRFLIEKSSTMIRIRVEADSYQKTDKRITPFNNVEIEEIKLVPL